MFLMAALAIRGFFTNRKTKKNAGAAVKQDTTHFLGEQQMVRIKLVQYLKTCFTDWIAKSSAVQGTFIIRMNMIASWVSIAIIGSF